MFMHHIIHIDFLEMFSNIMMESTVTLDIAPTYSGAPAASSTPGRRLGTRGEYRHMSSVQLQQFCEKIL